MARTARVKKTCDGTAYYHLMSRTNDRRFLFDDGEIKTQLVDALKRAAAFSGVEIDAYVAMDNHFHVVCKVVRAEGPVPEDGVFRKHVAALRERGAKKLVGVDDDVDAGGGKLVLRDLCVGRGHHDERLVDRHLSTEPLCKGEHFVWRRRLRVD